MDGPERVHNEIRGLKDGYKRVAETYHKLLELRPVYKNLRLKVCSVYSGYNQECIGELFELLRTDFSKLDRVVFSVAHGTVNRTVNSEDTMNFHWKKYFEFCENLKKEPLLKKDLYSVFTTALRFVKTDFLKEVLRTKNMYKYCGAGRKVLVVDEGGQVYPCEQLWHKVGDLRQVNYDLNEVLRSYEMTEFHKKMTKEKCSCHWGLALSNALLYEFKYYPKILLNMMSLYAKKN